MSRDMAKRSLYRRLRTNAQVRLTLFVVGMLLMIAALIVGPLPGPGFIILFPAGLMLSLQNSLWAKRVYVRFKRSEEHTSELQSLMRISYAVFCLKKKKTHNNKQSEITI